ncbi:hypothetical protein BLL52_4226 [Rhodoferax antarcticus ANT.BR]|uniref:Uncharacterized protein n=1 Tax=Rhodoferax antarcticus ANT.BR TaxID=1111071 RepID=A0A1Q8Y953_9BURK|nr:hypothetical protein BLL52_4226 [Rhodoferax antarcticus ANT.BR]
MGGLSKHAIYFDDCQNSIDISVMVSKVFYVPIYFGGNRFFAWLAQKRNHILSSLFMLT